MFEAVIISGIKKNILILPYLNATCFTEKISNKVEQILCDQIVNLFLDYFSLGMLLAKGMKMQN